MKLAYALAASVSVLASTVTLADPTPNATPSPASPAASPPSLFFQGPTEAAEPTPIMVEGTIVSADPVTKAVVILVGKRKQTFQTSYLVPMRNGRLVDFGDLTVGLKVQGCAVLEQRHLVLKTLTAE